MGKTISDQYELQGKGILGYHNDQLPDDSDFDSAADEDISLTTELPTSTGVSVSITDVTTLETRAKSSYPPLWLKILTITIQKQSSFNTKAGQDRTLTI